MKRTSSHVFLSAKDYRLMMMTSAWQGAPYFRRYGRGLVSKPTVLLKKSWAGYRRTTLHYTLISYADRTTSRGC